MLEAPRLTYNAGTVLDLTLPPLPHTPTTSTLGGKTPPEAAVPAAYLIRRDHFLVLAFRVLESEQAAFLDWLEWAQEHPAVPFTFTLDRTDGTTAVSVLLTKPAMTDDVTPTRDSEYLGCFQYEVTLRSATGARLLLPLTVS